MAKRRPLAQLAQLSVLVAVVRGRPLPISCHEMSNMAVRFGKVSEVPKESSASPNPGRSDPRPRSRHINPTYRGMLLLASLAAAAFAPTMHSGSTAMPIAHSRPLISPATTARANVPLMTDSSAAADVVRVVAALPTMYCLMSLNEYMTHRYFQHLEFNRPDTLLWLKAVIAKLTGDPVAPKVPGDGHVEHHAETYDDMSLKNDERWRSNDVSKALDDDEFRGTAFHWSATAIMTVQMMPSVLPTYALMGWSLPDTLAFLMPCMLLHAVVWNAIHPPMHGLPPVPLSAGFGTKLPGGEAFSNWLLESAYGRYIYQNHMGHHVLSGQCNYNVCCPFADHLLGTYVPIDEWSAKMRPLPENAVVRGPVVEPQSHGGVPQLPTRAEYLERKKQQKARSDLEGSVVPTAIANGGVMIADAYSQ